MEAAPRRRAIVGDVALHSRPSGIELINPVVRGAITHWDAVEALWSHLFTACVRVDPLETPVVATTPSDATDTVDDFKRIY